jgi:hypothetical protein
MFLMKDTKEREKRACFYTFSGQREEKMSTKVGLRQGRLALALCLLFAASSIAVPQTIKGYWEYKRDKEEVGKLLDMLKSNKKIPLVPEHFFGDVYNYRLPDLLFFIDKTQKNKKEDAQKPEEKKGSLVNIALEKKGKKNPIFLASGSSMSWFS